MFDTIQPLHDLVLKASSCPHGMISNLSLNLKPLIKMLTYRGKDLEKTKMKEKNQFENAINLGEKKGNQKKIRNRKKNSTHQEN